MLVTDRLVVRPRYGSPEKPETWQVVDHGRVVGTFDSREDAARYVVENSPVGLISNHPCRILRSLRHLRDAILDLLSSVYSVSTRSQDDATCTSKAPSAI